MANAKLQEIFRLIREVVDEAREEARQEILNRVLAAASEESRASGPAARDNVRSRAPKGTVEKLCDKALIAAHPQGQRTNDIGLAAESDHEKMVELSSIRSHLRKHEKAERYEERGGLWYLGPKHEAHREQPSAPMRDDLLSSTANVLKLGGA
jgi:hypothetical protein